MSMKPYRRAVAVTGTYEDRQTGQEKKRYLQVGTLFKGDGEDEGRFSLKLEGIPVGGEWNGWVSFFEIEDRRDGQGQGHGQQRNGGGDHGRASGGGYGGGRSNDYSGGGYSGGGNGRVHGSGPKESFAADLDDEIPF